MPTVALVSFVMRVKALILQDVVLHICLTPSHNFSSHNLEYLLGYSSQLVGYLILLGNTNM